MSSTETYQNILHMRNRFIGGFRRNGFKIRNFRRQSVLPGILDLNRDMLEKGIESAHHLSQAV